MLGSKISTVTARAVFFDNWLLRLEQAAFGWNYYGKYEEEGTPELDLNSGKINRHFYTIYEFRRKTPYSHNILFGLTEILSRIISFIRRFIAIFLIPALIAGLILAIATRFACSGAEDTSNLLFIVTGSIAGVYVVALVIPSLIISAIGFMWRKIFRLDEKLKRDLANHGYDTDLKNCTIKGEYDD